MFVESISLTSQPLFSHLLHTSGFSSLYIYTNLSSYGLIGLSHLLKLSLNLPISQYYRHRFSQQIQESAYLGEKRDIERILSLLVRFDREESEYIAEDMRDESLIGVVDRVYQSLFSSGTSEESAYERVLKHLEIEVLWYGEGGETEPNRGQVSTRAVYCPLYKRRSLMGVLIHERDEEAEESEQWCFPIAYEKMYTREEDEQRVWGEMIRQLEMMVRSTNARLNKTSVLKYERALKCANTLITARKAPESLHDTVKSLYGPILCDVCNRKTHKGEALTCGLHYSCSSHIVQGRKDCHICVQGREIEEDEGLIMLREGREVNYAQDGQLSEIEVSLQESSALPQCNICERNPPISLCACACLECWSAYLSTYVILPPVLSCLLCRKQVQIRDIELHVEGVVLRECLECKKSCVEGNLVSAGCRKGCKYCWLCVEQVVIDANRSCARCKLICAQCNRNRDSALLSLPCGHDVHSTCLRHNKCPLC